MTMDKNQQIQQIELFINKLVLAELHKVQQAKLEYMQFVLMGQTIEVLGSLLDNKPMKAKGQSASRFSKAVNYLFGGKYRLLNDKLFLYDKLRNQMVHTFVPSKDLLLLHEAPDETYKHLDYKEDKLVLIATVFYKDIIKACSILIERLKDGKIKPKNIAFEIHE